MLLFSHLRTLFTVLFVAVVIAACGGSSGGSASPDTLADDPSANQPVSAEVLGDDVDADGIRDDVQMYIEEAYSGDLKQMRAAKRMAIADRKALSVVHDAEALENIADEAYISTMCWLRAVKGDDPFREEVDELILEYSKMKKNSDSRVHAQLLLDMRLLEAQKNESGNIWDIPCPL